MARSRELENQLRENTKHFEAGRDARGRGRRFGRRKMGKDLERTVASICFHGGIPIGGWFTLW